MLLKMLLFISVLLYVHLWELGFKSPSIIDFRPLKWENIQAGMRIPDKLKISGRNVFIYKVKDKEFTERFDEYSRRSHLLTEILKVTLVLFMILRWKKTF
jgi:hypothetical protein